ncbi:MAG TPA: glycogen debranching N-terminal domain-containing protein, partial [Acidimicrobiia bacterium]|nr:glycogen debranching N-terminal domain-containing protein [Acidimicrobiia bacterium]
MSDPWNFTGKVALPGQSGDTTTLVEESTFAISSRGGDLTAPGPQGLFVRDTRILSRFELLVNGERPEPLAAAGEEPFSAVFVTRLQPRPGRADSTLMVFRARYVGQGMREDLVIRNFADEATFCSVELFFDSDFADLFAVKEGRRAELEGDITREPGRDQVEVTYRRGTVHRGVVLRFSPAPTKLGADIATFEVIVPARGEWRACIEVHPVIEGKVIDPRYLCGQPVERGAPSERLAKWRRQVPQVDTDHEALGSVLA